MQLELESEEGGEKSDGAVGGGAGKEEDGEEPVEEDKGSGEGEEGDSEEGAVVSPFCIGKLRLTAAAPCCRQLVTLPYEGYSQLDFNVQMKQGGHLPHCREGNGDIHTNRRARDRNDVIMAGCLVRAWRSGITKLTVQSVA